MNALLTSLGELPLADLVAEIHRRGRRLPDIVSMVALGCPTGCQDHEWSDDLSYVLHRVRASATTGEVHGWVDVCVGDNLEVSAPAIWVRGDRLGLDEIDLSTARAFAEVLNELIAAADRMRPEPA